MYAYICIYINFKACYIVKIGPFLLIPYFIFFLGCKKIPQSFYKKKFPNTSNMHALIKFICDQDHVTLFVTTAKSPSPPRFMLHAATARV